MTFGKRRVGRVKEAAVQYLRDHRDILLDPDDVEVARILQQAGVYSKKTYLKDIQVQSLRHVIYAENMEALRGDL